MFGSDEMLSRLASTKTVCPVAREMLIYSLDMR